MPLQSRRGFERCVLGWLASDMDYGERGSCLRREKVWWSGLICSGCSCDCASGGHRPLICLCYCARPKTTPKPFMQSIRRSITTTFSTARCLWSLLPRCPSNQPDRSSIFVRSHA